MPRLVALVLVGIGLSSSLSMILLSTPAKAADGKQKPPPPPPPYVHPRGYVCYRATSPITIDGKLDDPAWQAVPWTQDFVDIEGDLKPKPRFLSRAKMLWDDNYFYVAAELEEPHVWATLTEHDSVIFQDPDFEVFIDPDGDSHEYYEFEINALNTGWDLFLTRPYKDGGVAINSWEIPGLKTAVHIDGTLNDPRDKDRGWTVEIAFPWKVLGEAAHRPAPPHDEDQWRINFSRVEWQIDTRSGKYRKVPDTKEDNWVWSPQGVVDMHRPETWGYVQFSTAEPGFVAFRPDPAAPVRYLFHQVYYAQAKYRAAHSCWAKTLNELGLSSLTHETLNGPIELKGGESTYEVSAKLRGKGKESQRWHIRNDARIWAD
jgi:hypothetical protein